MANKVRVIPATLARFSSRPIEEVKKRRVAAYARVSTDEDDQLTSYDAQVRYYSDYIKGKDDWEFVEVYADEGISGTHATNRLGFQRMIEDAITHRKIDLILTKSISRFARNTVDSLTYIRKLKDHGVEVYFEKENIYTFDSKGEMLLTIMSSIAQEESRSISENILWGMHRRFEEGKYWVGYSAFLGYDKGKDGKLVVNKEQAETVRYIFSRFLEGKTPYSISRELMEKGMKTGRGKTKWDSEAVIRILRNEKYCGNVILQKTFKKDLLAKREVNNGEVRKFFIVDGHEAIITPEQYDMAQQELEERSKEERQHSSKSIFTAKIVCGCCGGFYGSKVWHSTDKYRTVIWQCNNKFSNSDKCSTPHIKEEIVKEVYMKALNQLITNKEPALEMMREIKEKVDDTTELENDLEKADKEFEEALILFQDYIAKNAITEADLTEGRYAELEAKYTDSKMKVDDLRAKLTSVRRRGAAIGRFMERVSGFEETFLEFSEELWTGLAGTITVIDKSHYKVRFKSGFETNVEI